MRKPPFATLLRSVACGICVYPFEIPRTGSGGGSGHDGRRNRWIQFGAELNVELEVRRPPDDVRSSRANMLQDRGLTS